MAVYNMPTKFEINQEHHLDAILLNLLKISPKIAFSLAFGNTVAKPGGQFDKKNSPVL
jgi:hypothetical protein